MMNSSELNNVSIYTDFQGLNKLRMLARNSPDEALDAVARQFEALFTQTLLKGMRNTSLAEGIFDSDQSKMYQDLFDKQIATNLSQQRGMGLADALIRQLRKIETDYVDPTTAPIPIAKSFHEQPSRAINHAMSGRTTFASPKEYLTELYPLAKKIELSHGISATVLLAQSALETGWGKHIIPATDGSNSYNLFAIKADERWQGEVTIKRTLEYMNGTAELSYETFRSYHSFEESMMDYAGFIADNKRYAHAMKKSSDPSEFISSIHMSGYATDPEYANKINKIMASPEFVSVISSLKNKLSEPIT